MNQINLNKEIVHKGRILKAFTSKILPFFEVGFNSILVSIHLFRWIDSESLNIL